MKQRAHRILHTVVLSFAVGSLATRAAPGIKITGHKWTSIGPQPSCCFFPGGETGRVTSIAVDPLDADDIWIGTAGGGVWHTIDAGAHWNPTSDDQASLAIGAVAVAGCIAGSGCGAIYAGTGENAIRRDTYYGAGLLVGVNDSSGVHWTLRDGKPTYDFTRGSIYNVVLDRNTSGSNQVLYITLSSGVTASASESTVTAPEPSPGGWGIYKSLDNGVTWAKLAVPGSTTGPGLGRPTDFEIDRTDSSVLYAGFLSRGIFKSTDGGASWCPLNPGIPKPGCPLTTGLPNPTTVAFDHVEIDIYRQDHNHLYASFGQCPDRLLSDCKPALYESTDGGTLWMLRYAGSTAKTPLNDDLECPSAYSRYMHGLTISPNDPNVVFLTGYHLCKWTNNAAFWETTDTNAKGWMLHPDHHAVVFHDTLDSRAYDVNDGGVALSTDGGDTWTPSTTGLATIEFQSIATSPLTPNLIGGTQDNSAMMWTGSKQWTNTRCCGDGGYSVLERFNVLDMYVTSNHNDTVVPFRSLDGGKTWPRPEISPVYDIGINTNEARSFYPPLMETPGGTVYFGTNRLWSNTNVLTNFFSQSPVLSTAPQSEIVFGADVVTAVGVAPSAPNRIYLGYYSGRIWSTTAACSNLSCWPTLGTGLPSAPITWIAVDPTTDTTAYATVSGYSSGIHVFKTTDGGASWTKTPSIAELNGVPANTLAIDPSNGSVLLLGTDKGIYTSINGGNSWYRFSAGLPNVPVYAFAVDPTLSRTFAATHGRGAYTLTPIYTKTYVEGPIKKRVLDQPAFGGGFRANLGCGVKVKTQSGKVCASGNVDAQGGLIHTDAEGFLTSSKAGFFSDLPLVWVCAHGQCLSSDVRDCIDGNDPAGSVEVACGSQHATTSVAAFPASPGPPSGTFTLGGPGPGPMSIAGSFTLSPVVVTGDGSTRILCSVSVPFSAGQTQASVLHDASDSVQADPSCASSGVTAPVEEPSTEGKVEDLFAHQGQISVKAPEVIGGALIPSVRTAPGQATGVCLVVAALDDPLRGRIRSMKVRFSTSAAGAAGGTVKLTERSGMGECSITVPTTVGGTASDLANAVAAAFQAPGIPGPNLSCPSDVNPRDVVSDGAAVRTALASELEICVKDPGVGIFAAPTEICAGNVECDDANPCTQDLCNTLSGQCQSTPVPAGTPCEDGNACTVGASCNGGVCGLPVSCNDGNPCTTDRCNPASGACLSTPVVCDDGNPCTTDSCSAASGSCSFVPTPGAPCDDGDLCTAPDICVALPGNPIPTCEGAPKCDGPDPCTADLCDPATGACSHPPIECDDGNPCTTDICLKNGACGSFPLAGGSCDDGNRCTTGDACVVGPVGPVCVGQPTSCDDSNGCTSDSCDPVTGGCVHATIGVPAVTGLGFTNKTTMGWSAVPGAIRYNTYRGTIPASGFPRVGPAYNQTCFEQDDSHGDGVLVSIDAAVPAAGTAYYYVISETAGCGEGPIGADSNGTVVPNSSPCVVP